MSLSVIIGAGHTLLSSTAMNFSEDTQIHSNSRVAQLGFPNDPRYVRLETYLGMEQAKERKWNPVLLHQLWEWCVDVNKGSIEAFTTGFRYTETIVITAEIESGYVAKDDQVPFRCSQASSCTAPLQTEAPMVGRLGQHT
ncbi:hypothetical protein TNCV_3152271 [Trichonephila clavipes]|nr:hypothetical protein TNCV_3152271 [Trichonephila clavipes]